jgi:hypothetical protein
MFGNVSSNSSFHLEDVGRGGQRTSHPEPSSGHPQRRVHALWHNIWRIREERAYLTQFKADTASLVRVVSFSLPETRTVVLFLRAPPCQDALSHIVLTLCLMGPPLPHCMPWALLSGRGWSPARALDVLDVRSGWYVGERWVARSPIL